MQRIGTASDATKRGSFGTTYLPGIFLKFGAKTVLCAVRYIFNKVIRGTVQKLNEVRTKN